TAPPEAPRLTLRQPAPPSRPRAIGSPALPASAPASAPAPAAPAHPTVAPSPARPEPAAVRRALARRSFCTLATTSEIGRPHVAGVLYVMVDDAMFVNTLRHSRKARNIAARGTAAVCVPVRRLPIGPPSSIQFQAAAGVLPLD